MSELSPQDIARLEMRLLRRRDELVRVLQEGLAAQARENYNAAAIGGPVRDPGDASLADLVISAGLTHLERDARELNEAEAALTRIREGAYGRCIDCGREIERERLEANPTALRCIEDQQRYERERAGGEDATPSL